MEMELEGISVDASGANVAFDIGGSLVKVAYVETKGDQNASTIKLKKLEFSQFKEFIELLKKQLPPKEHPKLINATGIGILRHWTVLESQLNIKINIIDEMSMTAKAFQHLHKTMGEDLYHPIEEDEISRCYQRVTEMSEALDRALGKAIKNRDDKNISEIQVNPKEQLEKQFDLNFNIPKDLNEFILAPCGSGSIVLKVNRDGSCSSVNVIYACGKTFHAIATLLTGITSYEKMLKLAVKGNSENVTSLMEDVKYETPVYNFYNDLPDKLMAYHFGKVHMENKTTVDFKKEDLLAALLKVFCDNICRLAYETALSNGLRHVIFSGSFVDHPFVRKTMVNVWLTRATLTPDKGRVVQILFPKYASYLGVIGALLAPTQ